MTNRILSLTDFTEVSDYGVLAAFEIAKQTGGELILFHELQEGEIISQDLGAESAVKLIKNQDPHESNKLIEKWSKLATESKVPTSLLSSSKNLVDAIQEIVETKEINLIVLGSTSEYTRTDSKWMTHAQSIVKEVNCSILTIKAPSANTSFKNIVFASSFDQRDMIVYAHFMKTVPIHKDAVIHLVSIDTATSFSQPSIVMKDVMDNFESMNLKYKVEQHFYRDFSISSGIRHFTEEIQADLLVMSNKYKKPLKRLFSGNHTIWNVSRVDCPILTIDFK